MQSINFHQIECGGTADPASLCTGLWGYQMNLRTVPKTQHWTELVSVCAEIWSANGTVAGRARRPRMAASPSGWLTENPADPELLSLKDPRPPAKSQPKPTSSEQSLKTKTTTLCNTLTSKLKVESRCVKKQLLFLHSSHLIRLLSEPTSATATTL